MKKFTALITTSLSILTLTACTTTQTLKPTPAPTEPKIALVLSGGGAYGFAHIGVIDVLHNQGIVPDLIVGTSAGAIVGAVYASGKTPNEIIQIALDMQDGDVMTLSPSKQGLMDGTKLRDFINHHTNHTPIEQLRTPFVAVATQMHTKIATPFSTGDTGLAVQASASVPKLFIPPRIPETDGKKYIDGGATALLPARIAREFGAKIVISVNLMPNRSDLPSEHSFWQMLGTNAHANPEDLQASDVVITPNLTQFLTFDTTQKYAMIQAGRQATIAQIDRIRFLTQSNP